MVDFRGYMRFYPADLRLRRSIAGGHFGTAGAMAAHFQNQSGSRAKSEAAGEAIYGSLRGLIVGGGMRPGARLPTERAMAVRFKAARNTVRKTMNRLVSEGLVVRHVGRGSFVAEHPETAAPAPESVERFSLAVLLEARLLFEPSLAELVVARATEQDLLSLETHLAALRTAESWVDFKEAKYALHLTIARASKNEFIELMFEKILAARRAAGWVRPGGHRLPVSMVREAAVIENTAIVDALRRRDATAATQLIRGYLQRTLVSVSS
jgi:DNA-binding FadR family transcriptional regulator